MRRVPIFVICAYLVMGGMTSLLAKDSQHTFLNQKIMISFESVDHIKDEEMLRECHELLHQIEKKYSSIYQGSKINLINQSAGKSPVKVDDETMAFLKWSKELSVLSGDRFDITTAAFQWLYGFGQKDYKVPAFFQLENFKPMVGYQLIVTDEKDKAVLFKRDGVQISMDYLLNAMAFEAITEFFRKKNIKEAICSIGQNILVWGHESTIEERKHNLEIYWKSSVAMPVLSFKTGQVLIHERFTQSFVRDNKRYHGLLDPATGEPLNDNNMVIVYTPGFKRISLPPAMLMSMSPEEAVKLVEKEKNLACMIIDSHDKRYYSKKWNEWLKL